MHSPTPQLQGRLYLVKRRASRAFPQLSGAEHSGCAPLGLFADATYDEVTLCLNSGDYVALYTDGLLEARSTAGELYSFDRLKALFAERPTAEQAAKAAVAFGQDDDITVLTPTRLATREESTAPHSSPELAPA